MFIPNNVNEDPILIKEYKKNMGCLRCEGGTLIIKRNEDMTVVLNEGYCLLCGQPVNYKHKGVK